MAGTNRDQPCDSKQQVRTYTEVYNTNQGWCAHCDGGADTLVCAHCDGGADTLVCAHCDGGADTPPQSLQ